LSLLLLAVLPYMSVSKNQKNEVFGFCDGVPFGWVCQHTQT
jgi:hypothetical protein